MSNIFREVGVDPWANPIEARIEEDRLRTEVLLGHSAPSGCLDIVAEGIVAKVGVDPRANPSEAEPTRR